MANNATPSPDATPSHPTSDSLIDALNDTDTMRCCTCPSCNFYAPDYEQHKGEPCETWELIRAYAAALSAENDTPPTTNDETLAQVARIEVKAAVEEWFTDISLDDLFAVKGWLTPAAPEPCGFDMGEGDECLLDAGHDGPHS